MKRPFIYTPTQPIGIRAASAFQGCPLEKHNEHNKIKPYVPQNTGAAPNNLPHTYII